MRKVCLAFYAFFSLFFALFVVVQDVDTRLIREELPLAQPCPVPDIKINGTKSTTKNTADHQKDFGRVREVRFPETVGAQGQRQICKLKCIAGEWVGPICVDQQENGKFQPQFKNCKLGVINSHLVLTFRNRSLNSNDIVFPHGTVLQVRCREVGLYKMIGSPRTQCENGAWSTRMPSCLPTTLLTNFTEDSSPTILIRVPSGSASVEPSGQLAVFPGSTIHLECLYSRRIGAPDWTWTSPLGQYLTGWAIAPEERDWKYRLSIYYAKPHDSGTFTCATPRGITNSVTLHVSAIHCPPISVSSPHLTIRVEGTRLGHNAIFECPKGFQVRGHANITCRASGKWSSSVPRCELIKCPGLDEPGAISEAHLQLDEHNNSYGGRAVFSCTWGYHLDGDRSMSCGVTGNWTGALPKCTAIKCAEPKIPLNGDLIKSESAGMDGGRYAVGSLVQFSCRGVFLLDGEASIICTEAGQWSHPAPICKARCPYLGEPENGIVVPTKFSYEPGDELQINCNPGFESRLEARPKCLVDGEWSSALPNCTNYSQI